jgi:hypothetical protein
MYNIQTLESELLRMCACACYDVVGLKETYYMSKRDPLKPPSRVLLRMYAVVFKRHDIYIYIYIYYGQ